MSPSCIQGLEGMDSGRSGAGRGLAQGSVPASSSSAQSHPRLLRGSQVPSQGKALPNPGSQAFSQRTSCRGQDRLRAWDSAKCGSGVCVYVMEHSW